MGFGMWALIILTEVFLAAAQPTGSAASVELLLARPSARLPSAVMFSVVRKRVLRDSVKMITAKLGCWKINFLHAPPPSSGLMCPSSGGPGEILRPLSVMFEFTGQVWPP